MRPSLLIALISGVLLFFVLGFVAVEQTSKPSFCSSCHEMQTYYEQWNQSPHKEVDCLSCHSDHTITGKLKVKANGLRQVYVHLTQDVNPNEITAEVPKDRCLECHTAPLTGEDHIKITEEMQCTNCHQSFVHDLNQHPPSKRGS